MKKIKKGRNIVVTGTIGDTAWSVLKKIDKNLYQLKADAFIEGFYKNGSFEYIKQARKVIPGKKLGFYEVKKWPRLRKALHEQNIPTIHVPGGNIPIHYQDEMVVADYSQNGTHYFVIRRKNIGKYLKSLPLDDFGKEEKRKREK